MSSVGFIRLLYPWINGKEKFLAARTADTTTNLRLFDPRSRAIVSFPLRFHATSSFPPLPSPSSAHVYTNPGETPGDLILFRDRVGKRVWQTVSGKTLNARVSSYSRDTFSKSKRDEREKERERENMCVCVWISGIVDIGIVQIFKRRMFNSARYLVPHPCRSLQIRSERRDVLTEAKCDFKEEGSPMDHRAFRYRIEEISRKKRMWCSRRTRPVQTRYRFEK